MGISCFVPMMSGVSIYQWQDSIGLLKIQTTPRCPHIRNKPFFHLHIPFWVSSILLWSHSFCLISDLQFFSHLWIQLCGLFPLVVLSQFGFENLLCLVRFPFAVISLTLYITFSFPNICSPSHQKPNQIL